MSVTQPNLTVSVKSGCTGLILTDLTGTYNALSNPFGYGLPGGPSVNDVTSNTITLTYDSLGTSAVYVFTISSGTITAATLSLSGVTPVNILTALPSTSWPFDSTNPFDLTANYGVTLPSFADDVFKTEFQIEGEVSPDSFDFSTVDYLPVGCNLKCCISKKWQAIDPNCNCCNDSICKVMYIQSLYNQFIYATEAGSLTNALKALREAQRYCGETGGCGC